MASKRRPRARTEEGRSELIFDLDLDAVKIEKGSMLVACKPICFRLVAASFYVGSGLNDGMEGDAEKGKLLLCYC